MNKSSYILFGYVFILISAAADATLPLVGKFAYHLDMSPALILFLRNVFAFALLACYSLLKRVPLLSRSPLVFVQGIFLLTQELLFFYSLRYLNVSAATVIFYTYPVLVTLLARVFFKEKTGLYFYLGLIMALLGVALISGLTGHVAVSIPGIILAFAASICFALFGLISQKTLADTSPLRLTASFSLLAIGLLTVFFFSEIKGVFTLDPAQIGLGLITAVLNSLLGLVFFLKAIDRIGASHASLACTIEPVISIVLAMVLLHEVVLPLEWVGTALVLGSIVLSLQKSSLHKN